MPHPDAPPSAAPPAPAGGLERRPALDAGRVPPALAGRVGTASETSNNSLGWLILGDNLPVLERLSPALDGQVRCVYLDPPFNTGVHFAQYRDGAQSEAWLAALHDRARALHRCLRPDGSLWLHLDDNELHYAKVMLDGVFGRENFVASVVWQKVRAKKNKALVSGSHDTLLVYARDRSAWRRNLLPRTAAQTKAYQNRDGDPRGRWQSVSYTVRSEDEGRRAAYRYPITTPAGRVVHPPPGRHWNGLPARTAALVADNRLWFGPAGDRPPRMKAFLSEVQGGIVPDSWWTAADCGSNQEAKKELLALFPDEEPFATPKPERLLARVLQIASDPGELVLDPYAGSGTTAAVAHKLGRRWVAIEAGAHGAGMLRDRLARVVAGTDPGGVSAAAAWQGGGGFSVLALGSA